VLVGRRGEKRHHPVYIDKEVDVAAANHCLAAGQLFRSGEADRDSRPAVGQFVLIATSSVHIFF